MENFTRETKKALWHVYDMLNTTNTSDVHISQLKVGLCLFPMHARYFDSFYRLLIFFGEKKSENTIRALNSLIPD